MSPPPESTGDLGVAPGTRLGAYELLGELGEGGMGTVFLAQQHAPLRRRVAVKVINPGMDSRRVLARFEQERQALALMDHPNIAKVLDAGTTAGGRPYFVMELVKGLPITRFCDQERLSTRQRLEVFLPVCEAVQHAHHKGIIHRDLKPSNVLVALQDGAPVAKVIDFGVAKATGLRLTDQTVFTEAGAIVGTLETMAPEQAGSNGLDVDTRADVYSLGVILYELLAGSPPFTSSQLRAASLPEALRIVREVDPPRPSTRLSTSHELPALAALRRVEPERLPKLVHGELDWIVMKCLAKERGQRYDGPHALAADIHRHIAGEPVLAGPPTASYRLRKLLRRHRAAVTAAVAFVLLLVAATAVSLVLAARADRQRVLAEDAGRAARDAQALADAAARQARTDAAIAREVNAFLSDDLLAMASPWEQSAPDPELTVHTLLARASDRIAGRFEEQPRVEASIRETIARAYAALGLWEPANEHAERALALRRREQGGRSLETLALMDLVGGTLGHLRDFERAEALLLEARDEYRALGDAGEAGALSNSATLAKLYGVMDRSAEAETLLLETIDGLRRVMGRSHDMTLQAVESYAGLCVKHGRLAEAERTILQGLDDARGTRTDDSPLVLRLRQRLVGCLVGQGRFPEAETMAQDLLEDMRRVLGPEHPETLTEAIDLVTITWLLGKFPEAEAMAEESVAACERVLGPEAETTRHARRTLARVWLQQGRGAEALPILAAAADDLERIYGPTHTETVGARVDLGAAQLLLHEYAEARRTFQELLPSCEAALGEDHPVSLLVLQDLALALDGQELWEEAEQRWIEVMERARRSPDQDPARLGGALSSLGRNRLRQGEFAEAEAPLRECLELRERTAPDDWRRFNVESLLGGSLLGQARYAEAEPLLVAGYEGMKAREHAIDAMWRHLLTDAGERVVRLYEELGDPDKVAEWRSRVGTP